MDRGPARNEDIDLPEVRVIDEATKEVLGIMSSDEALDIAEEQGLIRPDEPRGGPPVCRIMNYSKYKYEQEKKQREDAEARGGDASGGEGAQDAVQHRRARLRRAAQGGEKIPRRRRPRQGHLPPRPRERVQDLGRDMFMRFCDDVGEEIGVREGNPTMEGNRMVMLIAPTKEKSANSVSTRQDRNQRKKDKAARNKAAVEEDEDEDEEDEDEDDQELDESYEEEEEEVVLTSKSEGGETSGVARARESVSQVSIAKKRNEKNAWVAFRSHSTRRVRYPLRRGVHQNESLARAPRSDARRDG